VETVKKAIQADENNKHTEAINLYVQSLDYFMAALQCKYCIIFSC